MMASNGSDYYPEHLNPFNEGYACVPTHPKRKRSNSFSETFRGLKNTLRKSFRAKKSSPPGKSSPVLLRGHNGRKASNTSNGSASLPARHTLPTEFHKPESIAWPRSRFKERLAKSGIPEEPVTTDPFVEENSGAKKKKKKAPLPPRRASITCLTLQVPEQEKQSKWSLTSAETDTDCSNYGESECASEKDNAEITETSQQIQEMLQQITRDMEKLTDDTNNNVTITETVELKIQVEKEKNDVPDVVVSCVTDENGEGCKEEIREDKEEVECRSVASKILMFEQNGLSGEGLRMIDDEESSEQNSPIPKLRKHKQNKLNHLVTEGSQ